MTPWEKKTEEIRIRIGEEEKRQVREAASSSGETVSGFVMGLVRRAISQTLDPRKRDA